nr:hypothetical protein [Actinomycetota bacterium]
MRVPLEVRLSNPEADEYVTQRVKSLGFRSAIPGGYASAAFSLHEPLSGSPPELTPFTDTTIYDARNAGVQWQGRLEDPTRGVGADGQVWQIKALGPSAHAKDVTRPLVYIDGAFGAWERWNNVLPGAGDEKTENPASPGSRQEALVLRFPQGLSVGTNGGVEVLYRLLDDALAQPARLDFTWLSGRNEPLLEARVVARSNTGANDQNLYVAGATWAGGSTYVVIGSGGWTRTDHTRLGVGMRWAGVAGTVSDDATWTSWTRLLAQAVRYNRTGKALLTPADYPTPYVRSHEVVEDMLGRPDLLPHYDADGAEIERGSYNIDQLAFAGGTTAAGVLEELMRLEPDYYWAAWAKTPDDKCRFEWRKWPTRIRYELGAGEDFASPASTAELYNAVNVRWRAADGNVRWTHRRGAVAELDSAGLVRAGFVDLAQSVGSETAAVHRAEQFLAEHSSPSNAGSITISSRIYDATAGRMVEPWEVRPGGLVKVTGVEPRPDALNPSTHDAVSVFRAVSTDYDSDRNATAVALDSEPATIATLVVGRR